MDASQASATLAPVNTTGDDSSQAKALSSAQRALDITALTVGLGPVPAGLVEAVTVALARAWDAGVEAALSDPRRPR